MKNTQTQYTMTKNKMGYEAPTIDILELRVEGGLLSGSLLFGSEGQNIDYGAGSGHIDNQGDF